MIATTAMSINHGVAAITHLTLAGLAPSWGKKRSRGNVLALNLKFTAFPLLSRAT